MTLILLLVVQLSRKNFSHVALPCLQRFKDFLSEFMTPALSELKL